MSIRIGSNSLSLGVQRKFNQNAGRLASTFERLSTGQRINRAADDAAGLAIAKSLDAHARIYSQGVRNLNDGISYTAIVGAAVQELKSILFRQRELTTQASNGTYSDEQREALQGEMEALSAEWNRSLDSTAFNGRKVFSAEGGTLALQAGIGPDAVLQAAISSEQASGQDDMALASILSNGTQGNGNGQDAPALSADGRYMAFVSAAMNLVPGDAFGTNDVFLKDFLTGNITRVSTDSAGAAANGHSSLPYISADGRHVVFESLASNLVEGDTNGQADIFVKDIQTGETRMVSTDSNGVQGDAASGRPSISADGRYVVFSSDSTNLVAGDSNNRLDVFLKDLQTGETTRVSTTSGGIQGNNDSLFGFISADGNSVAFHSSASNFVAGDTNGTMDVFVKDLRSNEIKAASTNSSGELAGNSVDPFLSADGRYVVFLSTAANLVDGDTNGSRDVFIKDLQTDETKRLSTDSNGNETSGGCYDCILSADGRYVAFHSLAGDLVPGDTNGSYDAFLKDVQTGEILRLSTDAASVQGNAASLSPVLSADGRYVGFLSAASNLVAGDMNALSDFFIVGNPFAEWSTISRNQWLSAATREDALQSQGRVDAYLSELNAIEGALGAVEARLGTAAGNLRAMMENFRAAESRIVDADIAEESAALVKTQILQQVSSSILAQANQAPALAVQLLSI